MRIPRLLVNNSGFTLLEMIIVMAVFTVILTITGKSFETVVRQTGIVAKSEETNIEGAIGLEMFRRDLGQAGFGLYTDTDITPPTFNEAASAPASNYNDTVSGVPRAIVAGNDLNVSDNSVVLTGTDYLVIKGTTVATNKTSQQWTYIDGITPGTPKVWGVNDLSSGDNIVALRQTIKNGLLVRTLIYDPANPTAYTTTVGAGYVAPFIPPSDAVQYYYYGINSGNVPRAPFNRTDYVVKRVATDVLTSCSPAAGILYKTTLNYGTSTTFTNIPLLDCVADMQIVLGWNTSSTDNTVDYYTNADNTAFSGSSTPTFPVKISDPAYIRQHLRLIKVYILAQDGGYDKKFTNSNASFVVGDADLGESTLTKTVDLTAANLKNYRWKLYRIVVRPKNLI